jgi:hypothetical protein
MPRCCATILDPNDGKAIAYAEVYVKDGPTATDQAITAATAAASATASAMCQTAYPDQPVPPVQTQTVNGKAKGNKFPPPSN